MEKALTSQSVCWRVYRGCPVLPITLVVLLVFTSACGRTGPVTVTDAEAERETNYQRAKKLSEQGDFPAAAEAYKKALMVNPEFAKAHLELGLLCDDKLGDPISAIYHYRYYLELRPDSDKKHLVEDFIERAKLSLAAKLPQSPIIDPSELTRLQDQTAALLQENARLRTRIAELEKSAGATTVAAVAAPAAAESASASLAARAATPAAVPAGAPDAVPPSSGSETAAAEPARGRVHVVQKGDTLYSLALRYYGTRGGWERIFEANRSDLPSKDQLKVGQQLVIP
ncbi:MAG TPA: LysM peptidoglycan-binding domain-containing protein [Verrucomicrobiae bacterium]|nr:LysM peptidoglycan-binding domain-containing protein [Verrucomicrobiae bacterium]